MGTASFIKMRTAQKKYILHSKKSMHLPETKIAPSNMPSYHFPQHYRFNILDFHWSKTLTVPLGPSLSATTRQVTSRLWDFHPVLLLKLQQRNRTIVTPFMPSQLLPPRLNLAWPWNPPISMSTGPPSFIRTRPPGLSCDQC